MNNKRRKRLILRVISVLVATSMVLSNLGFLLVPPAYAGEANDPPAQDVPTETATALPTATNTSEPAPTATFTSLPSLTPTEVPTASPTATDLPTATATESAVPTATNTELPSPTPSPSSTASAVHTPTETASPTSEASPSVTATGSVTATITETPTPTGSITVTATPTGSVTVTGTPTFTPTPTLGRAEGHTKQFLAVVELVLVGAFPQLAGADDELLGIVGHAVVVAIGAGAVGVVGIKFWPKGEGRAVSAHAVENGLNFVAIRGVSFAGFFGAVGVVIGGIGTPPGFLSVGQAVAIAVDGGLRQQQIMIAI